MKPPFFSIIIPVYNVEKYIHKCIDSILMQNHDDYEIILINDGSTDNSGKICDAYAMLSQKIKVIHQINTGLSGARNTGIRNASGIYLWFVDSDDWIAKNAIFFLAEALLIDFEMLGFYESRFIENEKYFIEHKCKKNIESTDGASYIKATEKFVPSVCFYVYKAEFIKVNQLLFKEKLIHEDDYFSLECFSKVKHIRKIDKVLYYYRIRENSIITGNVTKERLFSCLEIIRLCISLRSSNLGVLFIDSRIRSYLSMLFNYLVRFESVSNSAIVNDVIREAKLILPKMKFHKSDVKGVVFEKLLYNFSGKFYFQYKKIVAKKK